MKRDDLRLERDPGAVIRGEALLPEDPRGAVVICHGFKGFARWGFFPHLARRLSEEGFSAITFDFSGSGIGEDRETFTELEAFEHNTYTDELRDLGAVIDEAGRRGWIAGGYGLLGHSRGGGVAILHASRTERVRALVTWAAIATIHRYPDDVLAAWRRTGHHEVVNTRTGQVLRLGTRPLDELELKADALDIAAAAGRVTAPWLIAHGDADESVPVHDAHALDRAAVRSPHRVVVVEGAGHTFNITHPLGEISPELRYVEEETVAFFGEHLA